MKTLQNLFIDQYNVLSWSILDNPLIDADSYKVSHYLQYPPGTSSMFSYIEARLAQEADMHNLVFFGALQYILPKYLAIKITVEMVEQARAFYAEHGEPFNYDGFMEIATKYKGRWPLRIRAVPEGTIVPLHEMLMSVESTGGPSTFWCVSFLETMLLRVWYPITVCTNSYYIKQDIRRWLIDTGGDPATELLFRLHDFGSRGGSSKETVSIGAAAHLVNFMGSDTCIGVAMANLCYHAGMAGFSIPEHSSITSWGEENEVEAYRNILRVFAKPGTLVACVSDSYDLEVAVKQHWGTTLKAEVLASGARLVVRPDSGNPPDVVLNCVEWLGDAYGFTVNAKGFKVLHPSVRVIQGDGINRKSINAILENLFNHGWAAENVAFGMGGALLQQVNRDTLSFAMKCSSITVNGKEVDVYKRPKTDTNKSSKRGRLDLIRVNGRLTTIKLAEGQGVHPDSVMITVYEDGEIFINDTFEDVRARANAA
jgi:nicotinamide phosphoribosyltransferase